MENKTFSVATTEIRKEEWVSTELRCVMCGQKHVWQKHNKYRSVVPGELHICCFCDTEFYVFIPSSTGPDGQLAQRLLHLRGSVD